MLPQMLPRGRCNWWRVLLRVGSDAHGSAAAAWMLLPIAEASGAAKAGEGAAAKDAVRERFVQKR